MNNVPVDWPLKPPFVQVISAPPGSGKTTLLVKMLLDPRIYYQKFKKIYMFSPNFEKDPAFEKIKIKSGRVFDHLKIKTINRIIKSETKDNVLIIFDDMMGDDLWDKKAFQQILRDLAINHRHTHVSCIISMHAIKGMQPVFRECIDGLVIFKPKSLQEVEKIFETNNLRLMDRKTFRNLIYNATKINHNFLYINHLSNKLFHNFEEIPEKNNNFIEDNKNIELD